MSKGEGDKEMPNLEVLDKKELKAWANHTCVVVNCCNVVAVGGAC